MQSAAFDAIRTISRRLKMLIDGISILGLLSILFLLWELSFDFQVFAEIVRSWLALDRFPLALDSRAISALLLLGAVNFWIGGAALLNMWHLFDRMEKGEVFTPACGNLIRRVGGWVLAGAISMPVSRTLSALFATYGNPDGQKVLLIGIGSSEAVLFLVAGFLYAMGHVMAIGVDIERENRSFV